MPSAPTRQGSAPSALGRALAACRDAFVSAGFFSLFVNLLLPAIYMLQIYDRVLTSGSESTLWMLTLIAVFLFAVMGLLEWVHSQILMAASIRLDQLLGGRVFDAVFRQTLVLTDLAAWNEMSTRSDLKQATERAQESSNHTQRSRRSGTRGFPCIQDPHLLVDRRKE